MKQYITYGSWVCLYLICACLGFLGETDTFGAVLCTVMAVAFFVPGALLLYWGYRENDRKAVKRIRLISLIVLAATFVLLVVNLLSVMMPTWAGDLLHILLVLVSTPMSCIQHWFPWYLILFFWACLLMATFLKKKK